MRYAFLVLVAFLLSPAPASAQTAGAEFHHQSRLAEGGYLWRFYGQGYKYLTDKMGAWGSVYGESGYASAYGGWFADLFTYDKESTVGLGAAMGGERYRSDDGAFGFHTLGVGLVYFDSPKIFSETVVELYDTEEVWLRSDLMWRIRSDLAVGFIHQTGDGTGPRVLVSTGNPSVQAQVWVAPLFGARGGPKFLMGLSLALEKIAN